MSLTHDLATRSAIADLVTQSLDVGTAYAGARLQLFDAGNALLAQFILPVPAFQPAVNGVAAGNAIPQAIGLAAGTPVRFELQDRQGVTRIRGAAGLPGTGVELEGSGNIDVGRACQVGNLVYQAPA